MMCDGGRKDGGRSRGWGMGDDASIEQNDPEGNMLTG